MTFYEAAELAEGGRGKRNVADSLQSVIESTGGVPEGCTGYFWKYSGIKRWTDPLNLYLRRHNMEEKKDLLILAIESSCDETAAAVVKMAEKYCLM